MSTYLYTWFISYVQTDLAKLKGSTRGFEPVVVIIEYSLTFSYHLRRLDYPSVTPDHTQNTKECQLHTLKVLFWKKISKHLSKKVPNLWKTRNTRRFLTKLGKTRSTFKILGKSRKTRNAGKPVHDQSPRKYKCMGPDRDQTSDPWVCSQTLICRQTCYQLRYAAQYVLVGK